MKLFILRHGITGDSETDAERQLTSAGRAEVVKIIKMKKDELSDVTQIYSSPMIRVRDTLDIAANLMKYDGDIVPSEKITTGCRLKEITEFLYGLTTSNGDIMVSSHQSCTSIIVLWLTGEDVLIPNGSLLAIELDEIGQGKGKILWQESASGAEIKRTTSFADFV